MFCSKCGAQINGDTIFCPKCGTRTDESSESSVESNEFDDTMVLRPVSISDSYRNPAEKPNINKNSSNASKQKSDNKNTASNNQNTIIILLSVCIALMFVLIAIFAFKLSGTKKDELSDGKVVMSEEKESKSEKKSETDKVKDDDDTEDKSDEEENEPKRPASYSTIPVDMVYASSEREDDGAAFSASFASDSKLSTAWSPSAAGGIGESITLCFESSRKVHGIKIANGYSKSDADYSQNSRVKSVTVKFPDGNTYNVELNDGVLSMQSVDFGHEIQCSNMTVIIDTVYDETLPVFISEIEVF